jgi:predicted Zn-dependent protease
MDLWLRLKRRDLAIADGQRLLELEPDDDNLRKSIAWLLVAEGRYAEADDACRRCLAAHPDSRPLRYLQATIVHAQGHAEQAAALLVPLLASTPPFSPAALLQATMHMEASPPDADKAVALLQIALAKDLDPGDRQKARYLLSQALFHLKQDAKARQVLDEMRREQEADRLAVDSTQQPENLQLKLRAAAALLAVGKSDQGLTLLKRVLDNDADHPGANAVLADYYEKQGQADRAKYHRGIAGKAPAGVVP